MGGLAASTHSPGEATAAAAACRGPGGVWCRAGCSPASPGEQHPWARWGRSEGKQHSPEEQGPSMGTLQASPASLSPRPGGAPRAQLIDRVQFIGGILRDWGWKTEQGPTPNSGVNTLKNKPGGSLPCRAGGTLLWRCRGGGSPRCSGDRRSKHVAGQTSRHMVRYQVDGASEGRGGGGEARGALGLLSLAAVPGKVPPSPALPEAAAPARRSRRLQGGFDMEREKEREEETGRGRPVLPPRLLWRVTGRG